MTSKSRTIIPNEAQGRFSFWITGSMLYSHWKLLSQHSSPLKWNTHIPPVQGSLNTKGIFRMFSGRQWLHPWNSLLSTKTTSWASCLKRKTRSETDCVLDLSKQNDSTVCLVVIKMAYITFGITSAIIMRNVLNSHLLIQGIRSTQHWLCSVMHHIRWTWQPDGREREWVAYKVHICDSMCAWKCVVAYSWPLF